MDDWIDDLLLQSIAGENNLSETAFIVPRGETFDLRWFTPITEVALCGHATLHAYQVSKRGGELFCENQGHRVRISGRAVMYMQGEIFLSDC